jgi:hypothetical protein
MKRHAINLLAVLVITLGGLHLSAQDASAKAEVMCCHEETATCCGAICGETGDGGCWASGPR